METKQLTRITVYHIKGGVGKTRIALNLALTLDAGLVTNDEYSIVNKVLPSKRLKILQTNQPLPSIPPEIPIIFDLGGRPDSRAIKALQQSQFVLMPILAYKEDFQIGLDFIEEVQKYSKNIIIIINKTKKGEFQEITKICRGYYPELAVFEIKESKIMSHLVQQKISIKKIAQKNKLQRRHYEPVARQFDQIINYMLANLSN